MSWHGTRRTPLTAHLKLTMGGMLEELNEKTPPDVRARTQRAVDGIRAEIARREADPSWWIEVCHIGSEDNPRQWEALNAKRDRNFEKAARKARKELAAEGEPMTPKAIGMTVENDPDFQLEVGRQSREWIVLGTVARNHKDPPPPPPHAVLGDPCSCGKPMPCPIIPGGGAAEYQRLYALGKGTVLIQAVTEIRLFQTVSDDEKKG